MLGIDIIDGALLPALIVALLAGVVSFLSPCVLPIVPPYLAYMAGTSMEDLQARRGPDRRVVVSALLFVLGLSTVFVMLGIATAALGGMFLQYQRAMSVIAGIVIMVFGLHFLHILRIGALDREARLEAGDWSGQAFGAYVLGLAFAFGWTPCIGPVLGSILALVAQDGSVERGMLMMGIYALGLGLPFLLTAIFLDRAVGAFGRIKRHMATIERAMGLLLWTIGLLLLTGDFTEFSYWLLEAVPALGRIG